MNIPIERYFLQHRTGVKNSLISQYESKSNLKKMKNVVIDDKYPQIYRNNKAIERTGKVRKHGVHRPRGGPQ